MGLKRVPVTARNPLPRLGGGHTWPCSPAIHDVVGADYSPVRVMKHAWRGAAQSASSADMEVAGQRRGAGVIAMTEGRLPTVIALSTWFVAVRIGMTVPVLPGPEPAIT